MTITTEMLNESTRRTVRRLATINGITPDEVVRRMVRGERLDYFPRRSRAFVSRLARANGVSRDYVRRYIDTLASGKGDATRHPLDLCAR